MKFILLMDSSKKLIATIGLLFFILMIFLFIKTTTFIIEDKLPYTKIGTIKLPSSNQHHEYLFKVPLDSNYVLELHKKGNRSYIPEQILQKCEDKYPIIQFNFEALKNEGVLVQNQQKTVGLE